jgi:hypothetical protein
MLFCAAYSGVVRSRAGMQEAINAKHNTELEGRKISVKEAIPQDQIPPEARGRDRYRASSYRGYVRTCADSLQTARVQSCADCFRPFLGHCSRCRGRADWLMSTSAACTLAVVCPAVRRRTVLVTCSQLSAGHGRCGGQFGKHSAQSTSCSARLSLTRADRMVRLPCIFWCVYRVCDAAGAATSGAMAVDMVLTGAMIGAVTEGEYQHGVSIISCSSIAL